MINNYVTAEGGNGHRPILALGRLGLNQMQSINPPVSQSVY